MLYCCYLHFYKHLNPLISASQAKKQIDEFLKKIGINVDWNKFEGRTFSLFFLPVALDFGEESGTILMRLTNHIFQEFGIVLLPEVDSEMKVNHQIFLSDFDLSSFNDQTSSAVLKLKDAYQYHMTKIQMIEKGELKMTLEEAITHTAFYPKYGKEESRTLTKKLLRAVSEDIDEGSLELMAQVMPKCGWIHSDNDLTLEFQTEIEELLNKNKK